MGDTFVMELDPNMSQEDWDKFNEMMDELNTGLMEECKTISKEFGVSEVCALNIQYLRTRSRWTQELEDELIRVDIEEKRQPNICDWS
jgi:hypothetical protein